ncbi:WD domain, G-beta repeat-containing protein [Cardiosporidium cionae]|uniref:WD domain, G-beta repeat-containing protein n=1 Tax=Cardiosporidium cionae TaxID=476202 RepID=A0ABQ7JC25_9APIC|nr:WD domain, G-beta repeat-containing protein [Cardiosporidium cionae]|eukprot:KAF8821509.1 WD domain, G-beta repeat-containing protein [Cardiosporidium cionae]
MAPLKQIHRSALVEWCPIAHHPNLLALGGVGLDPSLELCEFDLASTTLDMPIQSSTCVDAPFRCLAWGAFKKEQPSLGEGIIAGGMDNGIVSLWNPQKLLHKQKESDGLIQRLKINSERVTCIEFNSLRPHLFAAGGSDGTVSVVDAADIPEIPTIYEPSSVQFHFTVFSMSVCVFYQADLEKKGEISCLGWNRVVSHILATTSIGGSTVILDLKQKKAATSFRDPANRLRPSSLSWLPSNATQIVVSYDDDRNPSLQLWDLRNASFPVKDITGHTKGILSVAFNTMDHHLMLSCGKDNRSICWILSNSMDQPEIFGEVHNKNTQFDIKWSPFQPGLYAAASMDEEISIFNIQLNQTTVSYIPKWMERTAGVHCGFGGKVVSFDSKIDKSVNCHVVATDEEFVMKADHFEQLLTDGNFDEFCYQKIIEAQNEHERLTWSIVRSLFHPDRDTMIRELGFDSPSILSTVEAFLGHPPGSSFQESPTYEELLPDETLTTATMMPDVDPEKFFMELSEKTDEEKLKKTHTTMEQQDSTENLTAEMHAQDLVDWNAGPESIIKYCLLTGNFIPAVEVSLRCGRLGDALILASMAGPEILKKTQAEYMRRQKDPFLKVVACIVNGEMEQLVKISDLANWRETLSLLCTYAPAEEFCRICELLGLRLEKERLDKKNAMICYLFAGNFSLTTKIWNDLIFQNGSLSVGLQDLIEKMAIMKAATHFNGQDELLTKHVTFYAEILANSGHLLTAMRYLSLIEVDEGNTSSLLRDRIYNSSPLNMQRAGVSPPRFPFEVIDVLPPCDGHIQGPARAPRYAPNQNSAYPRGSSIYPGTSTPPIGAASVHTPAPSEYYYSQQAPLNRGSSPPFAAPYSLPQPASTLPLQSPASSRTPPPLYSPQYPSYTSHAPPSNPSYTSHAPPSNPYYPQHAPPSTPSINLPQTPVHPPPPSYASIAPTPPHPPPPHTSTLPLASLSPPVASIYGSNVPATPSTWIPPSSAVSTSKTSLVSWPDAPPQLGRGALSASTNSKLVSFCQAIDENDFITAQKIHGDLIARDWDAQSKTWLPALMRLLTK